jgi:hypothetical protein
MKKSIIAIGVVAAFLLGLAAPAFAAKPTVQTVHTELTGFLLEDCGDFQIILNLTHDETITTFFDRSGAATSSSIQFDFNGTVTNSVTGRFAVEKGHFTIFVPAQGDGREVGLILSIVVPGEGVALLEVAGVDFDGSLNATLSGSPHITDGDDFMCTLLR